MMGVLLWLSIVAACVVVGMTYSRFTPGSCCGCSVDCEECQAGTARRSYTIAISGMPNQSCSACSTFNGSFVVSLEDVEPTVPPETYGGVGCHHSNLSLDEQICTDAENNFFGVASWAGSGGNNLASAIYFQIGDGYPGFTDTPGKIYIWVALRMEQTVDANQTLVYYATELTGTEQDNAIDCTDDLDGLTLPYVAKSSAATGNTGTACQWASATVTVNV